MRERILFDRVTPGTRQNVYTVGGAYAINSALGFTATRETQKMWDVVTPNYRVLSRQGIVVNNPMYSVSTLMTQAPSSLYGKGSCPGAGVHEYTLWSLPPSVSHEFDLTPTLIDQMFEPYSDESEIAQTAAWANIDLSSQGVQGAVFLGELPESIETLRKYFSTFVDLTSALKRRDLRRLKQMARKLKTLDGGGNLWLSYRYAIRPLIGDVIKALETLKKTLEKGFRFTARGSNSAHEQEVVPETFIRFSSAGGLDAGDYYRQYYTETFNTTRVFRAGVLVEVDRSISTGMALWGMDDIVGTAWELTRLSFIVDWFFNVGSVINAAILNPGMVPKSSWCTETIITNHRFDVTRGAYGSAAQPGCSQNITPWCMQVYGYHEWTATIKRRIPVAQQYSLPHLNVRLNASKLIDLNLIARKLLRR